MRILFAAWRKFYDFVITLTLWVCYVMGFLVFFFPFYLLTTLLFPAGREETFQRLNHRIQRLFFSLVRLLVPNVKWRISEEVRVLRSGMIIANHLSLLDPILLVSLFEKQKTIVKSDYFRFPVFGWILRGSGYIPSMAEGLFTVNMIDQIKNMKGYLASGGNLFIFPEGTRSRNGRLGPFDSGTFKMARLCYAAPIHVVIIRNTHKLFPPGRFLFNTRDDNVIEVELAGTLQPDYDSHSFSLSGLMAEARLLMEGKAVL